MRARRDLEEEGCRGEGGGKTGREWRDLCLGDVFFAAFHVLLLCLFFFFAVFAPQCGGGGYLQYLEPACGA